MSIPDAEQAAIRADAERRLEELRDTARRLWADDDAMALAELQIVLDQIRACERELNSSDKAGGNK
jgi:hypothetical protein